MEGPRAERSNSGSHATSVRMRSRRCRSSKPSPARCDFRKNWKTGPPNTKEKSFDSSTKLGSAIVCRPLLSAELCCVDAMRQTLSNRRYVRAMRLQCSFNRRPDLNVCLMSALIGRQYAVSAGLSQGASRACADSGRSDSSKVPVPRRGPTTAFHLHLVRRSHLKTGQSIASCSGRHQPI